MEVGNLYRTKCLYWMLYSSEDHIDIRLSAVSADVSARYWSNLRKISYIPPNSFFVLLEKKQKYCKVLSHEGNIGWIYLAEWCKNDIEELVLERLNENSY
jgi:hypothetical protein